jgi:hypothetical protein
MANLTCCRSRLLPMTHRRNRRCALRLQQKRTMLSALTQTCAICDDAAVKGAMISSYSVVLRKSYTPGGTPRGPGDTNFFR